MKPDSVFITKAVKPGDETPAPIGYEIANLRVMRREGETDEALQARAKAQADLYIGPAIHIFNSLYIER